MCMFSVHIMLPILQCCDMHVMGKTIVVLLYVQIVQKMIGTN